MNTILIVDDHILFREGIISLIGHWDDFEVVGEAASGVEALAVARELMPDLVLMDIGMPGMNGIEAARRIARELPSIAIVMLTVSEEEDDLYEALKYGARGYVLKNTPSRRLHSYLRGVLRGEAPLSGTMAAKILEDFRRPQDRAGLEGSSLDEPLTQREQEVLELVVEGLNNPEIAARLCLSEHTVKKYLRNVLQKLQLNNRVEAAVYAVRKGLVN